MAESGEVELLPDKLEELGKQIHSLAGTPDFRAAIQDLIAFAMFLDVEKEQPKAAKEIVAFTLWLVQSTIDLGAVRDDLLQKAKEARDRISRGTEQPKSPLAPKTGVRGVRLRKN